MTQRIAVSVRVMACGDELMQTEAPLQPESDTLLPTPFCCGFKQI